MGRLLKCRFAIAREAFWLDLDVCHLPLVLCSSVRLESSLFKVNNRCWPCIFVLGHKTKDRYWK